MANDFFKTHTCIVKTRDFIAPHLQWKFQFYALLKTKLHASENEQAFVLQIAIPTYSTLFTSYSKCNYYTWQVKKNKNKMCLLGLFYETIQSNINN